MCGVCETHNRTLDMLKPFLKEGVNIKMVKKPEGYQILEVWNENSAIEILADGDDGGYFHENESSVGKAFDFIRKYG